MVERLVQILLIAVSGAAGTLARFGITSFTHWAFAPLHSNPWRSAVGTLAVNIAGSFLFGLLFAITEPRMPGSMTTRVIVLTGFMGAFTTFSTFTFDAARLARDSQWLGAATYLALSIIVGVAALFVGLAFGARLAGQPIP